MAIVHQDIKQGAGEGGPNGNRLIDLCRRHPLITIGGVVAGLGIAGGALLGSDKGNDGYAHDDTTQTNDAGSGVMIGGIEVTSASGLTVDDEPQNGRLSRTFKLGLDCPEEYSTFAFVEEDQQPTADAQGPFVHATCYSPGRFKGEGLLDMVAPGVAVIGGDNFKPNTESGITATLPSEMNDQQAALYGGDTLRFAPDFISEPGESGSTTNSTTVEQNIVNITPNIQINGGPNGEFNSSSSGYLGEITTWGDAVICAASVQPNGVPIYTANIPEACEIALPMYPWKQS